MAKAYTTPAKVGSYLGTTIAADDANVLAYIEAISLYMDFLANRKLKADEADETLVFDGYNGAQLSVPDIQSITTITIDGSAVDSDAYYLYPANTKPYSRIVLGSGYFYSGRQNVSITGKFGKYAHDEFPADLELAATILTAGVVKAGTPSTTSNRAVKSKTIGRFSVTYETEKGWSDYDRAMDIVRSHRRMSF